MKRAEPEPAARGRNLVDDLQLSRRLRPVTHRCYLIVTLFVVIIGCILLLTYLQTGVLNAVRAAVTGEGLWAKAHQGAVYELGRYAATGDERHYRDALQGLAVIGGDRQARLELAKSAPDRALMHEGFITGGNHPDDVAALTWFFLRFQGVEQVAEVMQVWSLGDQHVDTLLVLAAQLHEAVHTGESARAADILLRIDGVQHELSMLEQRFSATLNQGARQLLVFARGLTYTTTLVLVAVGLLLSRRSIQSIRRIERALILSEMRFRRVVDGNLIGIFVAEPDGAVVEANDAFLHMLGYTRAEMLAGGLDWIAATAEEYRSLDAAAVQQAAVQDGCESYEKEMIRKDGTRVFVYAGAARFDDSGRIVCFTLDVTTRRQSEQQLRLASKVFDGSSEGILITDAEARIVSVNRAFTEITGYALQEVVGQNPRILKSGAMSAAFYREMWQRLLTVGHWDGEIYDRRKSGEIYPKWLNIDAVKDPDGRVSHYVAIFSDISERKAAQERLRYQAEHDPLTGLPNRSQFAARLERALAHAERRGGQLAVMFIDLDHFKAINDNYGHLIGDILLREAAARLAGCVRKSDTLSRQGGDEFVAVLESVPDADAVAQVAVKLIDVMSQPFDINGHRLQVGSSIGISMYPQDGTDMTTLMHGADAAMYRAKTEGRSSFRFYAEPAAGQG